MRKRTKEYLLDIIYSVLPVGIPAKSEFYDIHSLFSICIEIGIIGI